MADLDSHNGTRVNGEPVVGAQALVSGDVIGICVGDAGAALRDARRARCPARCSTRAVLRRRLDEELERARALRSAAGGGCDALAPAIRSRGGGRGGRAPRCASSTWPAGRARRSCWCCCPSSTAARARDAVAQLLDRRCRRRAPGWPRFPTDGCDGDTLFAAARAAAGDAEPGEVAVGRGGRRTALAVGERDDRRRRSGDGAPVRADPAAGGERSAGAGRSARPAPARRTPPTRCTHWSARAEQAVRHAQLRGAAGDARRERAVRPREGRVHRRGRGQGGPARSGGTAARCSSTRSASCRRRCRPSCCACWRRSG